METIAEHSLLTELIKPGDLVLDVGARRFSFSKGMVDKGCIVHAMEPDPTVEDSSSFGISLIRKALVSSMAPRKQLYAMWGNGTENRLVTPVMPKPGSAKTVEVECIDIRSLMKELSVTFWSAVKLDCEGAEYDILLEWPGPIAEQITVEFHEHEQANPWKGREEAYYMALLKHLEKWYRVVRHEKDVRHCLSVPNYWDSLFVLKH